MAGIIAHWGVGTFSTDFSNNPIAFLDRDGVINVGRPGYVNRPSEMELLPNAAHALAALREAGFSICVVTNQSAISRGLWDHARLESIHKELQRLLLEENERGYVDLFLTCPHKYEDGWGCRKPSPEMLHLGHRLLRRDNINGLREFQSEIYQPSGDLVDWWAEKSLPVNSLDLMVGDRRSDMGAGWAYGARIFRVRADEGVHSALSRLLDVNDAGDFFRP